MYKRSESFFTSHKPGRLFLQTWERPEPKGTVIITHGQGEHSECYHRLIDYFKNDSWNFIGWDLRGHGRSEGRRGYAEYFSDYLEDYKTMLQKCLGIEFVKNKPIVLLSHSMGAMIQLRVLGEDPKLQDIFTAQVCSAPFVGLAMEVPPWKKFLSHKISDFLPQLTLATGLINEQLTRDTDVIHEYEKDPLRHDRISPRVYLGFLENFAKIPKLASAIHLPTLFQLPENDPVANTEIARQLFKKLGSEKKYVYIYSDAMHEIYNDLVRKNAFADLKKYLDSF